MFQDPNWNYEGYEFEDYETKGRFSASVLNATDTDLSKFKSRQGKIIMFHGWSDSALTAFGSIGYYEEVQKLDANVQEYFRLFMAPGVLHCIGGPGPSAIDYLSAIENWVEKNVVPDYLVAGFIDENGQVSGARPVCAYPKKAFYKGSGNTRDPGNFTCQ